MLGIILRWNLGNQSVVGAHRGRGDPKPEWGEKGIRTYHNFAKRQDRDNTPVHFRDEQAAQGGLGAQGQ